MKELIMRDDYADNWEVKKLRTVEYDDLPDDYIIDEDGKMVVMPTEELYDDGSDEDEEDSSDEEEKAAFSGSADTRERRAVSDEFRRTGKGQGYDRLTTPGQVAAYRSSYGLGPANPRPSNPRDRQPAPNPRPSNPRDRMPAPKRPFPPVSMPVYPGRPGNDPGFRRPAPKPRVKPAPMPMYPANETNDQGFMKSAQQPLRDPEGGLTAAGRKHFKETEGANLKPGVKGAADTPTKMRRKGSFLVRFFTNPTGPMVDPKGRPTRLALSARAWGEPVPQDLEDAAKLAAKGRRLLDRYRSSKEESKGQKSFEQFQLSMKSDEYSKALTDQQAAGLREAGKFFGDKDKGKERIQKFYSDTRSTGNTIPRPNTPVSRRGSQDSQLRGYDRAVSYARSRGGSADHVARPRFMSDSQKRGYDRAVSYALSRGGSADHVAGPRFDNSKGEYESQWDNEDDEMATPPDQDAKANSWEKFGSWIRGDDVGTSQRARTSSSRESQLRGWAGALGAYQRYGVSGRRGMIERGNIDVSKRRVVKLPGGDHATVRSIGINDNGKEVLIPTIGPRGENWSSANNNQQARDHYKATGQHLGKFNSVGWSNYAGQKLHESEEIRTNTPVRRVGGPGNRTPSGASPAMPNRPRPASSSPGAGGPRGPRPQTPSPTSGRPKAPRPLLPRLNR